MSTAGARQLNLAQAVNEALADALAANPDVVVLGRDVGAFGGMFRTTAGLQERFGADRVVDTPGDEASIVGTAIGMALYGLRPVAELEVADVAFGAFDQIVNELAKIRYRSGGQLTCPVTLRLPSGAGVRGGMYHSQSPEAHFAHTAGLTVVCPSTPADAKGLLLASVESDDPVVFLEPKALYRRSGAPVPERAAAVPFGKARWVREGGDVTLIAWGAMVRVCEEAAQQAAASGIECAILDPRTLAPLDIETLARSLAETGRGIVVHEAPRTCGLGAEIVSTLHERCFLHLEAPIARVTGYDMPVPYALEEAYLPDPKRVLEAIEGLIDY